MAEFIFWTVVFLGTARFSILVLKAIDKIEGRNK